MNSRWVVRTCKVVELIEREIPQLMSDLEGSQYYDRNGEECGWRQLLAERLNLIRPCTKASSYARRINGIMNQDFMLFDADIADAICIALGTNIEHELVTYPKHKSACEERILIEWEIAGVPITKAQLEREVKQRFAKYQREMFPDGKVETRYQVRDREYRRAKRAAAKAAA